MRLVSARGLCRQPKPRVKLRRRHLRQRCGENSSRRSCCRCLGPHSLAPPARNHLQLAALVCMQLPVPSRRREQCATFPRVAPGRLAPPARRPSRCKCLFTSCSNQPCYRSSTPPAAPRRSPVFAWCRVNVGGDQAFFRASANRHPFVIDRGDQPTRRPREKGVRLRSQLSGPSILVAPLYRRQIPGMANSGPGSDPFERQPMPRCW